MHGILSTVKNSGGGRESVTNPHKHKYCKITQILQVQIGGSSDLSSRSVRVPIRPYRPPMVRLCFLRAVDGWVVIENLEMGSPPNTLGDAFKLVFDRNHGEIDVLEY